MNRFDSTRHDAKSSRGAASSGASSGQTGGQHASGPDEGESFGRTSGHGLIQATPLVEPLELTSVWEMPDPETAAAALAGSEDTYVYRRDGHPNASRLANELARFHGGDQGIVTAQGMSAIAAVALACLRPGDRAWISSELYGKTAYLFAHTLTRWGVEIEVFDPTDPGNLDRCVDRKPKLVVVETMSNPRLRIPDLKQLAARVHAAAGLLLVDNTFATHYLFRPLEVGCDVVVESLSKQVCGHSDAMLGLVCTRDPELFRVIADHVSTLGLASSPLDCFLTHRGLATLEVRMERACKNALILAQTLRKVSGVRAVDYPGLPDHPQHDLARRMFGGSRFGWMLCAHLAPDPVRVNAFFKQLAPEIPFAPSLGDVRTTVSHPATTSHRNYSAEQLKRLGIDYGSVRISCGIEPTDFLVERFVQALRDA